MLARVSTNGSLHLEGIRGHYGAGSRSVGAAEKAAIEEEKRRIVEETLEPCGMGSQGGANAWSEWQPGVSLAQALLALVIW